MTDSLALLSRLEANRRVVGEIFGRLDATAAVPRLRQAIEDWQPVLVVRESAEFGAAVAAELHDVPQLRVGIGLAELERYILGTSTDQEGSAPSRQQDVSGSPHQLDLG